VTSAAVTLPNLLARISCRLLCLAACIHFNHQLGRPSRSLTTYRLDAESTIYTYASRLRSSRMTGSGP
jgi:hypothetical protein